VNEEEEENIGCGWKEYEMMKYRIHQKDVKARFRAPSW